MKDNDLEAIRNALLDSIITGTGAYEVIATPIGIEVRSVPGSIYQAFPFDEPSAQYSSVDMATAAAQAFRDGRASVVVELPDRLDYMGCSTVIEECKKAIFAAGGSVKE